jgi:hypothetical protein
MALYKDSDKLLMDENVSKLLDEVKRKKLIQLEPRRDEVEQVTNVILSYIRQNKRKAYGGFALNILVKDRNINDAIYSDLDIPDIDFYSPEPMKDLISLCNLLHAKKFKDVQGKEAMHKETYTIFVNNQLYCDISYVPRNIYNRMPFRELNGLHIIHPNFMTIDYLRMFTDPLISWQQRIEKAFKRFNLLQKYYPIPKTDSPIKFNPHEGSLKKLMDDIQKFIVGKSTLITVGFYAYNHFLNESGILDSKVKSHEKYSLLEVPCYEIISTRFREDALELVNELKTNHLELTDKIHVVEHYPFFQFIGHSAYIYFEDKLIAKIYHHNKKCLPFQSVPAHQFRNKQLIKSNEKVQIGSFSVTLMFILMVIMQTRTLPDDGTKELYHVVATHLLEFRNYFFERTKKHFLDKTLFQDFIVECVGETITADREKSLLIASRKKKMKKYNFAYRPADKIMTEIPNYMFANSSGGPVQNTRNLKLTVEEPEDDIEGDIGDDDENEQPSVEIKPVIPRTNLKGAVKPDESRQPEKNQDEKNQDTNRKANNKNRKK